MPATDKSFTAKLADMVGLDREEVEKHLADMDLDPMLDLVDAVAREDRGEVRSILGVSGEQDESEEPEGDELDAINPLMTSLKGKKPKAKKSKAAPVDEDEEFIPNFGDEVRVGDDEGTVKIARGPGGTVGVQIDGETTMVNKNDVKRGLREQALAESMLGMSGMLDLGRMQQLAGLKPTIGMLGGAGAPEECEREGPVEAMGTCPEDSAIAPPSPAPIAPIAPLAAPLAATVDGQSAPDLGGVLTSFDDIESRLGDLKVRDVKTVRDRINKLLAKLNESEATRRRKV